MTSFDIPDDIQADVSGPPPARAKLARHTAWIKSVEGDLAKLIDGNAKLEIDLGKADGARRQLETLVNDDAASLVTRIKSGLAWTLSSFGGSQALSLDAKLAASKYQSAVAERALSQTHDEIARVEAQLVVLRERKAFLVAAAVREAAAGLFEDYSAAANALREATIRLTAMEQFLGIVRLERVLAEVPDIDWRQARINRWRRQREKS
jgi:hypothetical protein